MNIWNSYKLFELRNEEINVKKILAVINATYATLYISQPDNDDSISAKKRDIGTLNMFLFYIVFTNDLP